MFRSKRTCALFKRSYSIDFPNLRKAQKNTVDSDIDIEFLGTSSSSATFTRNVSSLALNFPGGSFLFDCGEGTIRQMLRTNVKPHVLQAVFITHLHGDHIYGLPGLGMSLLSKSSSLPLFSPAGLTDIFAGKRGLRGFTLHSLPTNKYSEVNRNIQYDAKIKAFILFENNLLTVKAAYIRHSVPCLGFIVQEKDKRGRFKTELLDGYGIKPGPKYGLLQQFGECTLDDGRTIYLKDVCEPSVKGRKIVILGDTCDPYAISDLAMDADVLVHEATCNNDEKNIAINYMHSTSGMAGAFAKHIRAKKLILTHFSPRNFSNNEFAESIELRKISTEAKSAFGSPNVFIAEDFKRFAVPQSDSSVTKHTQLNKSKKTKNTFSINDGLED